jgi:DNA (cytosine-5)-methyltransferase 1
LIFFGKKRRHKNYEQQIEQKNKKVDKQESPFGHGRSRTNIKRGAALVACDLCNQNNFQLASESKICFEERIVTHGSLFSGIGGFDYAAERVGFKNVFQIEVDNFCHKVLEKNFPNVKKYRDIKLFDGRKYRGTIDILSGGFPCQPYSISGIRKGKNDDRALWPEMYRVIKEIQPAFVLCENVPGIITMELDEVLFDLESEGYKTETFVLPAVSINAPHRRDRVWIICYSQRRRRNRDFRWESRKKLKNRHCQLEQKIITDSNCRGWESSMQYIQRETSKFNTRTWNENWIKVATELCGMDDGLPVRMDGFKLTKAQHRTERIKSLGNAIVHEIAMIFFLAIKEFEFTL